MPYKYVKYSNKSARLVARRQTSSPVVLEAVHFPKLDVAGSIPVSRSINKEVMLMRNKKMKAALEASE